MLKDNPNSETCGLVTSRRNEQEPKTSVPESSACTKEFSPQNTTNTLALPDVNSASQPTAMNISPTCDTMYSLPVDNIPNSTSSTKSTSAFTLRASPSVEENKSKVNSSSSSHTSGSKLFRHGLGNPSNNINVPKAEEIAASSNTKSVLPNKSKMSTGPTMSMKLGIKQIVAGDPACLENNNNLSLDEEKLSDKTDKKSSQVQNAKSSKKKRRRTNNSNERDCHHQENLVPESMKVKGLNDPRQSENSPSIAEAKQKRTIGDALLGLFRKPRTSNKGKANQSTTNTVEEVPSKPSESGAEVPHSSRALPPTPCKDVDEEVLDQLHFHCEEISEPPAHSGPLEPSDIAASIEKVKDCGWYWGPLSSEAAEDLLRGEPDGSFIVRDSSDSHYIFSLTFKLNSLVRHVRIEHDHGNFSFGPMTRFKATTIVDFVEKAIAHSRSGRYLFFLHRRPVLGPMRVQLIHPYSRFRHMRSLQHMCRFAILKHVRRDLINSLPLPNPLLDYLHAPHYYFEEKPT